MARIENMVKLAKKKVLEKKKAIARTAAGARSQECNSTTVVTLTLRWDYITEKIGNKIFMTSLEAWICTKYITYVTKQFVGLYFKGTEWFCKVPQIGQYNLNNVQNVG